MKSSGEETKGQSRFDKVFETIEIETIVSDEENASYRICAVMRALLEIGRIFEEIKTKESKKEAA